MGHLFFWLLHLIAVLFVGMGLLFFTIPLHLIYAAVKSNKPRRLPDVPSFKTHVRCPDCRELVRADANKCKHCGVGLVPQKLK